MNMFSRTIAVIVIAAMVPAAMARGGGGGGGRGGGGGHSSFGGHSSSSSGHASAAPARVVTPATAAKAAPPSAQPTVVTPATAAKAAPPTQGGAPTTGGTGQFNPLFPGTAPQVRPAQDQTKREEDKPRVITPVQTTAAKPGGLSTGTVAVGAAAVGLVAGALLASPSTAGAQPAPAYQSPPAYTQTYPQQARPAPMVQPIEQFDSVAPVVTTPHVATPNYTTASPIVYAPAPATAKSLDFFDHIGAVIGTIMRWVFWLAIVAAVVVTILFFIARGEDPELTFKDFILRKKKQVSTSADVVWPRRSEPPPMPPVKRDPEPQQEPVFSGPDTPIAVNASALTAQAPEPEQITSGAEKRMEVCFANLSVFCCCLCTADIDRALKVATHRLVHTYAWDKLERGIEVYPQIEEIEPGKRTYMMGYVTTKVQLDYGNGQKEIYTVSFDGDNRLQMLENLG